jgi:hypothetical protein
MGLPKVRNTKKAQYKGLEFDSTLELNVYKVFEEAGIDFVFKPEKIILLPPQKHDELRLPEEVEEALRINKRDAVCKADKTAYTRKANLENNKELREMSIREISWSIDFMIPLWATKLYVEAKGHPNDAFPIKLKMGQKVLNDAGHKVVVVKTKKDAQDLVYYLFKKKLI